MSLWKIAIAVGLGCLCVDAYVRALNTPKVVVQYVERDLDTCLSHPQAPYSLFKNTLDNSGTTDFLRV